MTHGDCKARLFQVAPMVLGAAMLVGLTLPASAPAQGCSMCRETAAMQKDRAITALQRGIAVLSIAPLSVVIGVAWLTWKRANRFTDVE